MMKYLLPLIFALLMVSPVFANITNPHLVDYMKAEVDQHGYVTTEGKVNKVELIVSIPQEDSYQKIENIVVNTPYTFYTDDIGNRYVKIIWDEPETSNEFDIKTIVSVKRRFDVNVKKIPEFIEPTTLVDYEDPKIVSLAQTFRGTDFEKVAKASKWIVDNTEYDMNYAEVNKSATWTLENKKGVCDEFTVLLTALTRSMGYYTSYVAGYAYGSTNGDENEFMAHGWAEVGNVVSDPTWSQTGFLDATHVKFADLKDASYTQISVNSFGAGKFDVSLEDMVTDIKVLNYTEDELIELKSSALENTIGEGYAVIKNDITTDRCILTKIDTQSCVDSSQKDLFKAVEPDKIFIACDGDYVFSILQLEKSGSIMNSYVCPITITPYTGKPEKVNVNVYSKNSENIEISVDKNILTYGEEYIVESPNSYIFTDNGDYGFDIARFYAPDEDFKVYGYKSGALVSQEISVIDQRPINANIIVNNSKIEIQIENLLETPQEVTVRIGNQTQTKSIADKDTFVFTSDEDIVQAYVNTDNFSTILTKQIYKTETKTNIFTAIIEMFKRLFGGFV